MPLSQASLAGVALILGVTASVASAPNPFPFWCRVPAALRRHWACRHGQPCQSLWDSYGAELHQAAVCHAGHHHDCIGALHHQAVGPQKCAH